MSKSTSWMAGYRTSICPSILIRNPSKNKFTDEQLIAENIQAAAKRRLRPVKLGSTSANRSSRRQLLLFLFFSCQAKLNRHPCVHSSVKVRLITQAFPWVFRWFKKYILYSVSNWVCRAWCNSASTFGLNIWHFPFSYWDIVLYLASEIGFFYRRTIISE